MSASSKTPATTWHATLAGSLNNLGTSLSGGGSYRELVRQLPAAFGGRLAGAQATYTELLDGLGRHEEAEEVRWQPNATDPDGE